jgi:hypothetical protein
MRRRVNLTTIRSEATLLHALDPLLSSFPAVANVFVIMDDQRIVSAMRALIAALYAPYQEDTSSDSAYQDLAYVTHKIMLDPAAELNRPYLNAALGILGSAAKDGRVSPEALEPIRKLASSVAMQDPELGGSLARLGGMLSDSNPGGEADPGEK